MMTLEIPAVLERNVFIAANVGGESNATTIHFTNHSQILGDKSLIFASSNKSNIIYTSFTAVITFFSPTFKEKSLYTWLTVSWNGWKVAEVYFKIRRDLKELAWTVE